MFSEVALRGALSAIRLVFDHLGLLYYFRKINELSQIVIF